MFKKIVSVVVLAAMSVTSVAAAQGNKGCYLYKDENLRGDEWVMWGSHNIPDLKIRRGWNDEVSSALVIGNCSLMLYEHNNYRGAGVYVNTRVDRLRVMNGGFNDEVSSVKCTCS